MHSPHRRDHRRAAVKAAGKLLWACAPLDPNRNKKLREITISSNTKVLETSPSDGKVRALRTKRPSIRRTAQSIQSISTADELALNLEKVQPLLQALLDRAVSDSQPEIRKDALDEIEPLSNELLATESGVKYLFVILHDEAVVVRKKSMCIIARLVVSNPSSVMFALRSKMLELLAELECFGGTRQQNESLRLMRVLLRIAREPMKSYVPSIARVLVPQLRQCAYTGDEVASLLVEPLDLLCVLANVGQEMLLPFVDELLGIMVHVISGRPGISDDAVKAALSALTAVVRGTGCVVEPYRRHPTLLGSLLRIIRSDAGDSWDLKQEAMRAFGCLGAVDLAKFPVHTTASVANIVHADTRLPKNGKRQKKSLKHTYTPSKEIGKDIASELPRQLALLEDPHRAPQYYPAVAIIVLMRILRNPALQLQHDLTMQAMAFILSLLDDVQDLLAVLVPGLLFALDNSGATNLRKQLFDQLRVVVVMAGRKLLGQVDGQRYCFLDQILDLVQDFWRREDDRDTILNVLVLLQDVSQSVGETFAPFLGRLMPDFIAILSGRMIRGEDRATRSVVLLYALDAIHYFSPCIKHQLHLVVPQLMLVVERVDLRMPDRIRAIHTLMHLVESTDLSNFCGVIIHPLERICLRELRSKGSAPDEADKKHNLNDILWPHVVAMLEHLAKNIRLVRGQIVLGMVVQRAVDRIKVFAVNMAGVDEKVFMDRVRGDEVSINPPTRNRRKNTHTNNDNGGNNVNFGLLTKTWMDYPKGEGPKEDWMQWRRALYLCAIQNSPSRSINKCLALAQVHQPSMEELFFPAFKSCWYAANLKPREKFITKVQQLNKELHLQEESSIAVLPTILHISNFVYDEAIRNMKHMLPRCKNLGVRAFSRMAKHCHAYPLALNCCERELRSSVSMGLTFSDSKDNNDPLGQCLGSLVELNKRLGLSHAASGVLTYAQKNFSDLVVQDKWVENLGRWDTALAAYDKELMQNRDSVVTQTKRAKCLFHMWDWERLWDLGLEVWPRLTGSGQEEVVAPWLVRAAVSLKKWDEGREYATVASKEVGSTSNMLYQTACCIAKGDVESLYQAKAIVRDFWPEISNRVTPLLKDGYSGASSKLVMIQVLSEFEEIIDVKLLQLTAGTEAAERFRVRMERMWRSRLADCGQNLKIWNQILMARSIEWTPEEEVCAKVKFASLCRRNGKDAASARILTTLRSVVESQLSSADAEGVTVQRLVSAAKQFDMPRLNVQVRLERAWCQHLWHVKQQRKAVSLLDQLVGSLEVFSRESPEVLRHERICSHVQLAQWLLASHEQSLNEKIVGKICSSFKKASELDQECGHVWRSWSLAESQLLQHYQNLGKTAEAAKRARFAIHTFFESVTVFRIAESARQVAATTPLASLSGAQQGRGEDWPDDNHGGVLAQANLLRLLSLYFLYGDDKEVNLEFKRGIKRVSVSIWLPVIPQLIARIGTPKARIKKMLDQVLRQIGLKFPHVVLSHLTVASKSGSQTRKDSALKLIKDIQRCFPELVAHTALVYEELIRVAVLWPEQWSEGLKEASSAYFLRHDAEGMLAELLPLHETVERGPTTASEVAFVQAYGAQLSAAKEYLLMFSEASEGVYTPGKLPNTEQQQMADLNLKAAWELYHKVFMSIKNHLKRSGSSLHLQYVSPKLLAAQDLLVPVLGQELKTGSEFGGRTTRHPVDDHLSSGKTPCISRFLEGITVMSSKQRPRRIAVLGDDGIEYPFLLKGHEDLRQDERVMQIFALVNELLNKDLAATGQAHTQHLSITRYPVVPLSLTTGMVGWVQNTDTLHQLIKVHRKSRKIPENLERTMLMQAVATRGMNPKDSIWTKLTMLQKLEQFQDVMDKTSGRDLARVMEQQSKNKQEWLDRRNCFTQSLAVMSIVGYLLGLGDRHPSNLMMQRESGKIVHIDFGDCWEVTQIREKYPETIPFRLTRMLVSSLEVSGVSGTFGATCEMVMRVLRDNKLSVMAMLEAFVHDPLINWRLLGDTDADTPEAASGAPTPGDEENDDDRNDTEMLELAIDGEEDGIEDDMQITKRRSSVASIRRGAAASFRARTVRTTASTASENPPTQSLYFDSKILNTKATKALKRVQDKLNGCDRFNVRDKDSKHEGPPMQVKEQVEWLIGEATSYENLCQCYHGWCPYW